jgi:hypothetical protein
MKNNENKAPGYNDSDIHHPFLAQPVNPSAPPMIEADAVPYPVATSVYLPAPVPQYQQPSPVVPHQYQQQPLLAPLPHVNGAPPQNVYYGFEKDHHHHHHHRHSRHSNCIMNFLRLVLFHILNGILGVVAFSCIITGVSLSIGLLPLCCFGLVIFRIVIALVGLFGELDVRIYNLTASPDEKIYVNIPREACVIGFSGQRLAPSLSSFSPLSLLAIVYFATIKFAMGILSIVSVALTFSIVNTFFLNPRDFNGICVVNKQVVDCGDTIILIGIASFFVGMILMHLFGWLSAHVTRFFCCERFETYRYVQRGQYMPAVTIYGTTTV